MLGIFFSVSLFQYYVWRISSVLSPIKLIYFSIYFYIPIFFQCFRYFIFRVIGNGAKIQNLLIAKAISLRFSTVELIDITLGSLMVQRWNVFIIVLWNDLYQEYSDWTRRATLQLITFANKYLCENKFSIYATTNRNTQTGYLLMQRQFSEFLH